eukprot:5793486-Pleurochrysis_carterae.AAC.2
MQTYVSPSLKGSPCHLGSCVTAWPPTTSVCGPVRAREFRPSPQRLVTWHASPPSASTAATLPATESSHRPPISERDNRAQKKRVLRAHTHARDVALAPRRVILRAAGGEERDGSLHTDCEQSARALLRKRLRRRRRERAARRRTHPARSPAGE